MPGMDQDERSAEATEPDAGTNSRPVSTSAETNKVKRTTEKSAGFRSLAELGLETSFKAFKAWDSAYGPRRHVVEPYTDYTFVPEPTVTPDELYQFDAVDELDEEHNVKIGVRNKLQTRKEDLAFDLVDADVYTVYHIETDRGRNALQHVFFDVEFRPPEAGVALDVDGRWGLEDSEMQIFNTELSVMPDDLVEATAEYRFKKDDSSLLSADVTLFPKRKWAYNVYGRYEFEDSRMEEEGGFIQRNLDCLAVRAGAGFMPGYTRDDGTERDDEFRVMLEMWLTAFPDVSVAGRHKN